MTQNSEDCEKIFNRFEPGGFNLNAQTFIEHAKNPLEEASAERPQFSIAPITF
jgi:hypothetical protein